MEAVSKVAIGLLSAATMDMKLLEHVQAHVTRTQLDGHQRYQDAIVCHNASIFFCLILVLTVPPFVLPFMFNVHTQITES